MSTVRSILALACVGFIEHASGQESLSHSALTCTSPVCELATDQDRVEYTDPVVEDDPRHKVGRQTAIKYPQVLSVGRIEFRNDKSHLTGTLVTRCHVLANLHLLQHVLPASGSLPSGLGETPLLRLEDEQLALPGVAAVTVGFKPNGRATFADGYDVLVPGTIVKTGRTQLASGFNYDADVPTRDDWLVVRLDNWRRVSDLTPVDVARSDQAREIEEVLLVGYPQQLIARDGQGAYSQKCHIQNVGVVLHDCVVTHGQSSSPLLAMTTSNTSPFLIVAISSTGKFNANRNLTDGVPASSFRDYLEHLKADTQCN